MPPRTAHAAPSPAARRGRGAGRPANAFQTKRPTTLARATGRTVLLAPPVAPAPPAPPAPPPPLTPGEPVAVAGVQRALVAKVATTFEECRDAYDLVARSYRSRGYEAPDARGLRFTASHALPDTTTFVVKDGPRVVATLSLVLDNTLLGLPIETVFGPEVDRLRREGRRVAEVIGLADEGLGLREFVPVFVALMRMMAQYFNARGADALVITINPRHRNFYQKVMGFVPLAAGWRAHPTVEDAPAEAYLLDVPLLRNNAPKMYRQIYGEPLPAAALLPAPLGAGQVRHFGACSSQTTPWEVEHILAEVADKGNPRRWAGD